MHAFFDTLSLEKILREIIMKGQKEYQKKLALYAKMRERSICDILCERDKSTFEEDQHNMQIEEQSFIDSQIRREVEEFEKAELYDNLELERKYGRADKKR